MNILLTGASGFIGKHLTTALVNAGHQVKPVTRSNGLDFNCMTTMENWLPHLQDIDAVINCVGIIAETGNQSFEILHHQAPIALFKACTESGIKRVIQISALGTNENAITPYHTSRKKADDVLRTLSLDWFILRPSLVYGRGGKSMNMFQQLSSLPVIPLMDGGKQIVQPVHISDLVETIVICLTRNESRITLDVVGASAVSLKDWLQLMRTTKNKKQAMIIPVPYRLSMAIARFSRFFIPLTHPDNLRMLRQGYYTDVTPFAKFLGHMPLDLKTGWSQL